MSDADAIPEPRYRLRGQVDRVEKSFVLEVGEMSVGSSKSNDVVLTVPGVSRRHARLRLVADGAEVEDMGSRNGTFVNDRRVEKPERIEPGDTVRFGAADLRLEEVEADDAELGITFEAFDPSLTPPADETTMTHLDGSRIEKVPLPPELSFPPDCMPGISPAMLSFYESLLPLLATDLPVLIEGETGVGKESVAHTLHLSSTRRQFPFVAVNCAAIPDDLLEAEMFGIGEGVATGVKKRPGKFRLAEGGTLFLDEIGEMPPELQAKLLRALQEKEIQPLGEGHTVPVDVWVIAATNVDLLRRVEEKKFRRDLYYRVAGFVLRVPLLSERRDDIPLFVEYFLWRTAGTVRKSIRGVTKKALKTLVDYSWPGNVRELEHEVKRLAHLCPSGQAVDWSMLSPGLIERAAADTAAESQAAAQTTASLRLEDHVQEAERRAIVQALEQAEGSRRKAAVLLGVSRNTLARKIQQLDIDIDAEDDS